MIVPFAACSAQQQPESKKDAESSKAVETAKEAENNRETIYQVALLQSLTQGYYDGIIKVSELKKHGDTGIGTFEGVNGEMIVLDGKVYQAFGDGTVKEADDNETVPFSNVTYFDKDLSATLSQTNDINALKESLTKTVNENGRNLFYFVKINGTFKKMNVRSELKQEKPYKSLDKALATDQREFNYDNIAGTVVALYCPDYMGGLNTPGWHFHFISDDKTKGGHILDLAFDSAQAEFDATQDFDMYLSDNSEFQKMELSKDVSDAIKKVETNEE
jgi:acetolactate decarboxylase